MAVLFTADTHFGHAGAIALFRRPFATVADMDQAMIDRWNEAVGVHDEVWHLGDFAVRQKPWRVADLLRALNGTKHLIVGNNDGEATTADSGWSSVRAYAEITVDGAHLVLCHYAFRTWRNMGKGWLDLHGHSHGRLAPLPRQCDVGVDAWAFRPATLGEIRQRTVRTRRATSHVLATP
ncbi:MAG TPA: metallophosphoesterase family protein [Acetobacteraceae bacterium]|jgi:calcineurin-like phosphoesterase family protein|nr:metallophosphoesterase family protein [Acetobacteraceae bacterium]